MPQHICARCAAHQKTCCQTREIYATPDDVERIRRATGREAFYSFRIPENPDYLDQDDDPAWRDNVFRADKSRRTLDRKDNGDCVFLGEAGCTLALETRPLVCRIYPFDYTEQGILADLAEGCPLHLLLPGEQLLTALDMKRVDAERWQTQLYTEIGVEPSHPERDLATTPTTMES